ncbi:MAG TPA: ShlB/FhaC/HecB family hemolysin secretion/activation protein, partial [Vineibacter sp.]|nr:ShlB/FhaC/HecB family hemolysin secretion/activation protein [Vineibacter sp.]
PAGVLEAMAQPLIGRRIAASEMFALAQQIEARYRADGYVLTTVFVPAQRTTDGRVTIRIVEGYIANVAVEGDVGDVAGQVKRILQNVTRARPARLRDIERYLLLVQELPGLSLKAILRPGREPGSSELVAQVRRSPWDAQLQADNRGSRFTGPQQVTAMVGANAFTGLAERLEATYFTTLDREQNFGQITWSNFIGDEGLRLRAYYGHGWIKPGAELKVAGYDGVLTVAGGALSFPVIRSRAVNLNVFGAYDYYSSDVDLAAQKNFNRTRLSVLRMGGDISYRDSWNGVTFGNVRLSQGVSVFGASRRGDPLLNRVGADPTFFKINGEVSRLQGVWQGDGFALNLYGTVAAQYANDILPSNEKYFVGGDRLGRGYYAGQVTGDKALAAALELQLNLAIPYDEAAGDSGGLARGGSLPVQLYAFYDHARVWNNAPLEIRHQTARSFGVGIRVSFLDNAVAELEGTRRLDRGVDGATARRLDPWNLYARLTVRF